jgi:hypothetical protein
MELIDTRVAFYAAAEAQEGMTGSALARDLMRAVAMLRTVSTEVSDFRALDERTLLSLNSLTA